MTDKYLVMTMKRGRKLVVAFLLFITVEALLYTIYYGGESDPSFSDPSDPVPLSDHIPLTVPKHCRQQIFNEFPKNLQKVKSYPIGNSGTYLQGLGLSGSWKNTTAELPVIVTAASSNHYAEVKAMFGHLERAVFPYTGPLKVIFFDIGLSRGQLLELKTICKCEMRGFPFNAYPKHVGVVWGFTWKPLIIQMMLNEFGFVMWMDSSVAIKDGSKLAAAFRIAKTQGISISWSGEANPTSLAAETYTQTFDFLREKPCTFRESKEFYATFMILFRNKLVDEAIMRPWVSCALTSGCMYMNIQHYTECTKNNVYSECHRFDRSVLSIILNRLFHGRIKSIRMPVPWRKCDGHNSISYLPSFVNDFLYHKSKSGECKGLQ